MEKENLNDSLFFFAAFSLFFIGFLCRKQYVKEAWKGE